PLLDVMGEGEQQHLLVRQRILKADATRARAGRRDAPPDDAAARERGVVQPEMIFEQMRIKAADAVGHGGCSLSRSVHPRPWLAPGDPFCPPVSCAGPPLSRAPRAPGRSPAARTTRPSAPLS